MGDSHSLYLQLHFGSKLCILLFRTYSVCTVLLAPPPQDRTTIVMMILFPPCPVTRAHIHSIAVALRTRCIHCQTANDISQCIHLNWSEKKNRSIRAGRGDDKRFSATVATATIVYDDCYVRQYVSTQWIFNFQPQINWMRWMCVHKNGNERNNIQLTNGILEFAFEHMKLWRTQIRLANVYWEQNAIEIRNEYRLKCLTATD